jgi:hypothetical protein
MSEFSSSFHIRTSDAASAEQRLAAASLSGLAFGPSNGWLTFVPYANSRGFDARDPVGAATALANATGSFVLQYTYAEDHMWLLALARPGEPVSSFASSWDPQPRIERDRLDLTVLDDIVPRPQVEPFLAPGRDGPDGTPRAYGFAQAIGLPAFRWLSPDLIEADTKHFLEIGGRRIGRKPADRRSKLPAPTRLALPKSEMSAREAFALLKPLMTWFQPPWALRELSGGNLDGWDFRAFNAKTRETIRAYLTPDGNAGCKSLGHYPPPASAEQIQQRLDAMRADPTISRWLVRRVEQTVNLPERTALPEHWLDSPDALAIARSLEPPPELGTVPSHTTAGISLIWQRWNPEPRWEVSCGATVDDQERRVWFVEIDAVTGIVLREELSRRGWPWRERIGAGRWQDIVEWEDDTPGAQQGSPP